MGKHCVSNGGKCHRAGPAHQATGPASHHRTEPAAFESLQSRCDMWVRRDQPVGAAYNVLKDAMARGHRENLHFVRYENLTAQPWPTLAGIYTFRGLACYEHDFEQVEPWMVYMGASSLIEVPLLYTLPMQKDWFARATADISLVVVG